MFIKNGRLNSVTSYGKYSVALFFILVIFIVALLLSIYSDVKRQAIDDLSAQEMLHARQAARGIQDHMMQVVQTLEFFAQLPQIGEMRGEGKKIMASYQGRYAEEIRGVTRVDRKGRITYTVPYNKQMSGVDISGQPHIREIMRTHKPVISDAFITVQGFRAVAVHAPVFKRGVYDGTIAFLLSFDRITKHHIENIRIGKSGYAWVISKKGYVISCPLPGRVGKNVLEEYRGHPRMLAMVDSMLKGNEGFASYGFDDATQKGRESRARAAYAPIPIGNTFWSIAVVAPENEALASMSGLHMKFISTVFVLLMLAVAYTFFVVRSQTMSREQKARESIVQALEENEALYRALIETTNTGFVVVDFDGKVLDANAEYVRLSGHESIKEIRGRSVLEWTAVYDKERNKDALVSCIEKGRIRNFGVDYKGKMEAVNPIEINATVVERDGKKRILTLCRDVKDRRRLEAQLLQAHKMESVGRLAGGVAHDFNNMLSVIIGYAETALRKIEPSNPLHHNFQEILKAGRRSADLTRQLLAFARKQIVHPRVLNLNDTVLGMFAMLQRLIGEEIELVWKPARSLWPTHVDPSQIDQILANLLVNAKDAIAGPGKIIIETGNMVFDDAYCAHHLGCKTGEYVMLAVSDNGCGMSKEVLANIFDPFYTTKDVGQGTGLGLATVYGIVKQNDGYINVYSEPGKGATIKLYFPHVAGRDAGIREKQEERQIRGGTETILLVEDDEAVLALARGVLEELKYKVLVSRSPTEAIRAAGEYPEKIHLLVTDVVMPAMNGKELYQHLLGIRPDLKCLYMSGYTSEIIADHGILENGVNFMQKPFSMQVLAGKVRQALD